LLPVLRKQIIALSKFWTDLNSKIDLLTATEKRLQKKMAAQQATLETLEQKVKRWHEQLQAKQVTQEQIQSEHMIMLATQKKELHERLKAIKKDKELLPHALDLAKVTLQKLYAGPEGKKLLQHVLQNITNTQTK